MLKCRCFVIIALLMSSTLASAKERTNPFSQPDSGIGVRSNTGGSIAPVELRLKAVMPAKVGALANINGELLNIGESINGFLLVEVKHSGVQLKRGNETFPLLLQTSKQ